MTRAAQVCRAGELHTFYKKHAQLTDKEIRVVEQGRAVARILRSSDPHEIYVFGAFYVTTPHPTLAPGHKKIYSLPD